MLSVAVGHFDQALLAICNKRKLVTAMGSYGDRFLNCVSCGLEGKCVADELPNGAEPLTDCDFAWGHLCNDRFVILRHASTFGDE